MENLEVMKKLTKDIKNAAATLSTEEARYLVDLYYQVQEYRKSTNNQCRFLNGEEEPHETLAFFAGDFETLEKQIKTVLQKYVEAQPIGKWLMSITGIGPVISAGLIANIDISKVQTADKQRTEYDRGCKKLNVILSESPERVHLVVSGEGLAEKVEGLSGRGYEVGVILCDDKAHGVTHRGDSHGHKYRGENYESSEEEQLEYYPSVKGKGEA